MFLFLLRNHELGPEIELRSFCHISNSPLDRLKQYTDMYRMLFMTVLFMIDQVFSNDARWLNGLL
jgi:hypothetical protein